MNGIEYYKFLRKSFTQNGQPLYGNFSFNGWLYKTKNLTFSFKFNVRNNNPKSIPQNIIIAASDANKKIDDNWLRRNFNISFHKDCRLHMLNFILHKYSHLRK